MANVPMSIFLGLSSFQFYVLGYNGKFTWEGYLKYTKSLAAPTEFFGEVSICARKFFFFFAFVSTGDQNFPKN